MDNILTIEAVSEIMKLAETTVLDKIRKGELKAHKKAGRWYVLYSDLLEYVKA